MSELYIDVTHQLESNRCLARIGKGTQCTRDKRIGDFCRMHSTKTNIIRIDQVVPSKTKLKQSNDIAPIIKRFYIQKINSLRGPALFNRRICNNDEDMYTMDSLEDIHPMDFFSFEDKDGFIYGFHIQTIEKHIEHSINETSNPYTKDILSDKIIKDIKQVSQYSQKFGLKSPIVNDIPTDKNFITRNRILNLFQKMDTLNNYTNISWFLDLDKRYLLRLIENIKDLFYYRMSLTSQKQRALVPGGKILRNNISYYKSLSIYRLRNILIDDFENLVNFSPNRDDQYLGSLIILSGLVDISSECALAYPWLVQSTF